jgi:acyl-CoA synthetase (NDP forming)
MLAELRLSRSASLRARFAVELSRLRELIVLVSRFAQNHPEIAEMDLNPVILTPGRTVIVDAKLLLGATPQTSRGRRVEGSSAAVRRMLEAKSIAVVGASADRRKQGGRMFGYLVDRGFAGNLYPVNTHEKSIAGHRCFPTVDALPEAPDLACIAVPADGVAAVVEACGRRGVQAVAVFTSGFGETGEEGRRREQALVELARRYGMRVCGPNTAGFMNESTGVCATISMAFEAGRMPRGNVAMISQSGALGGALLSRAWDQGIGLATWICTGNEADLTLGDYMQAMVAEPRCAALVVFMETIRDPRSFTDACSAAQEAGKPVVVYRSGTSAAGRQAMQTHTGAIAGDDAVLDAVFGKHGVIRVRDLQSLLDLTSVLERTPLPSGNRVAVVSASGGACGIVADECERRGLRLANLSAEATAAIAKVIPPFGVPSNPIDMTMEITVRPDMAGKVVSVVLAESGVDAVLVVLTTNADPPALEVARGVINAANTSSKPVLVARLGADSLAPRAISLYRQSGMPVFPMPERAVATLRGLYDAGCAR